MYHGGYGYLMRDMGRLVGSMGNIGTFVRGIWDMGTFYVPSNSCNNIVQPSLKVTPEIWASW